MNSNLNNIPSNKYDDFFYTSNSHIPKVKDFIPISNQEGYYLAYNNNDHKIYGISNEASIRPKLLSKDQYKYYIDPGI